MSDYADDTEISMTAHFGEDTNDSKTNGENASNQDYDQETDQRSEDRDNDDRDSGGENAGKNAGKTTDDEERKLFLGGLSWDTDEQDLRTYFGKFGPVSDVSIKYDAVTGNPRGFGFITFSSESTIDAVLKGGPHVIRNKTIDPKRAKSRPICKKIFVGGVDANMTEDEIKKYFNKFGTVEGIELPFDRQRNRRREFCFIIFEAEDAAEAAVKEPKQIIGNKECDIKKAQPQPVAQQQKRLQQNTHGQSYDYDGHGTSRGRGRRNQSDQQSDQWGYNGAAQSYYQNYYGTNQYPNAYGANAYQGYDYYGQYYGQYSDYWNYYGYGDGTTPAADYSQTAAVEASSTGYGSAPNSQSSSHSHSHHGSGGGSGGKMIRKSGSSSSSGYHPYRSSSGH